MSDKSKRLAAERAIEFIQDGQVVGLGTGSTAKFAIEGVAAKVRAGFKVTAIATSLATARMAEGLGIPLADLNEVPDVDITIDGADEIDGGLNMIKGGGGALTREKLVALASKKRVIIVDERKLVSTLGESWPVPVEVLPFAWTRSALSISALGCAAQLRRVNDKPFETDNGNYILDCNFGPIINPSEMEKSINLIPGVVECGLFVGIADLLVVGFDDDVEVRERKP
ncbi:MAG TPA: ribose-5-phosphate isomerase RpiA [Blastocatellia bacterium]|jgi:ribose 5-phosphate isomerase A|nr:ribose-5-phosphate isomerase RpiA [Blastocatellia bacterium]